MATYRLVPILPDPHAPEPLPQLAGPARTPTNTLLPIRVFLPVAYRPRLPFHAHRASLSGGRGHFDGVGAFGCVPGVLVFVLLEGFFDGVGGFAFAFEVFRAVLLVDLCVSMGTYVCRMEGTYHAWPALVGSAFGGVLDHHVRAFFVGVNVAVSIFYAGRYHGDSV